MGKHCCLPSQFQTLGFEKTRNVATITARHHLPCSQVVLTPETMPQGSSGQYANCEHLTNVNSLAMVVDVAPQTELGTYTGLYYFFSTAAAVIGPNIAGFSIEALGGDYGIIFVIAPITLAFAFVFMLGVRRGERAE